MKSSSLPSLLRIVTGPDNFGWAPLVWANPDI